VAKTSSILKEIQRIEDIPGCVYLIRNKDLYKIGITVSIKRRLKELKPDEVIAVKKAANMRGIEKILHTRYKHCRVPQTEYFRLSPGEVQEASYLLGVEAQSEYTPSEVVIRESEECNAIGSRAKRFKLTPYIQKTLEELESLLVDQLGFDALYTESEDAYTGAKGNIIEIIAQTDNNDPGIKIAVSEDLRSACARVMNRDDIFLPVVQADTESEAASEIERITCDFSLIYLWGSKEGLFRISHQEGSTEKSYQAILAEMERICRGKNVWYTTREPFNAYWVIIVVALISCFIYPMLGIPAALLVAIFHKKLRNSLRAS